ncbi:MAG TPA: ACP S-malonyltransferase [Acidimicrobiia bacterium]|nr:ACP S-malonyltransferase [Acidimicrobiia bacterium]
MTFAVLFPGQGSQFVGMGADVFAARPDLVGERADEILGFSLAGVCLDGPEEELTRTEHAQPALFAISYALWNALAAVVPPPAAAAGHSLGEYTALAGAGVLAYEVALAVVAERGRAMAAAADVRPSGMAAVIGADVAATEEVCRRRRRSGGELWVANVNAPGQVVVAGAAADLVWLGENARDLGLRRVIPLAVAGAFHSPLMEPASGRLAAVLGPVELGEPRFPVYANVSARPLDASGIVENLIAQVVSTVRFAETLEAMAAAGVDTFVHVGPGDVTAGLVKRTLPEATTLTVSSLGDISAVAAALT